MKNLVVLLLCMALLFGFGYLLAWNNSMNENVDAYAKSYGIQIVKTDDAKDVLCKPNEVAVLVSGVDKSLNTHRWLLCRTAGSVSKMYFWPYGETPKEW